MLSIERDDDVKSDRGVESKKLVEKNTSKRRRLFRVPYVPHNMFNIDLSKDNFEDGYREYMRLYMKIWREKDLALREEWKKQAKRRFIQ